MGRDRVTDYFGLVHYADGTTMYMDTGHIVIKTLCADTPLTMCFEKTSKPIPPTCFRCVDADDRLKRFYDRETAVRVRRRTRR